MGTTQQEWRDDPNFPFKLHLYGLEEAPGTNTRERLLASYWLARGKWDWHVYAFGKSAHKVGTSPSEEGAREAIYRLLGAGRPRSKHP